MDGDSRGVYRSLREVSVAFERGEASPLAEIDRLLRRIDAVDGVVHAFVRLTRESALRAAAAAEVRARRGARLGPLDGIGIAIKDNIDTAGTVTSAGTGAYANRVPQEDAACVALLRRAGAIILGKTNMDELAATGKTANAHFGATRNPWHLERVPGGSSGGSAAAVSAGECLGALGTDTSGSIRIPAAFCGVTGHKPSFGTVSLDGVVPAVQTLDHAGPIARTAEDCAMLMDVLAPAGDRSGTNRRAPFSELKEDVAGLRAAVIPSTLEDCDDAVLENFETALDVLRSLGVTIDTCEPLAADGDWRPALAALVPAELSANFLGLAREDPPSVSEPLRSRLESASSILAADYIRARTQRKLVERRFAEALVHFDVFVAPTSPITAEPISSDEPVRRKFRNTVLFDYSRQPSTAVPTGIDGDGLPTSLMISARRWNDEVSLGLAHAYQRVTDFHLRAPRGIEGPLPLTGPESAPET